MTRQAASQQYHPIPYDQESIGSQTPKKYNSVSDMKRRKQRPQAPMNGQGLPRNNYEYQSSQPMNNIYGSPMKTYSSSPDIPHMNSFDSMDEAPTPLPTRDDLRRTSIDDNSEYSRPYRPLSRPKTPPPPPPPIATSQSMQSMSRLSNVSSPHQYTVTSSRETLRMIGSPAVNSMSSPAPSMHHVISAPAKMNSSPAPPAPPPPPGLSFIN